MNYTVIAIGDELLIGQVTDTNSGWIARQMIPFGWEAVGVKVVPDKEDAILNAIDEAFASTDVILMTGGLGPTKDDITKPALCRYFGGVLVHSGEVEANVRSVMAKRHLQLNESTRLQSMVPSSCRVIENEVGTAPVMWFERDGKVLVSLPGVPHEMRTMMQRAVIPALLKHFSTDNHLAFRTYMVVGYTESALSEHLDAYEKALPSDVHLAYLPQPGIIRLRLSGSNVDAGRLDTDMTLADRQLREKLGDAIISDRDITLSEIVGERLRSLNLTLSTAESCTGGNIAHAITRVPGSSDYFKGAVVSYANEVKQSLLGVNAADIAAFGVVSEPVVRQMVEGVCNVIGTDCAVSTSGIAGPGGAVPGKPVGTVWMAAKCRDRVVAQLCQLPGDRERVISRATTEALKLLLSLLK